MPLDETHYVRLILRSRRRKGSILTVKIDHMGFATMETADEIWHAELDEAGFDSLQAMLDTHRRLYGPSS